MRTIERDIVGAFIFSADNELLLGKSVKGGVYQDQWIVPGGGVEAGETKLEAVGREAKEEVGLDVSEAEVEPIEGVSYGKSVKKLRDTDETVLVKMAFYDFIVRLKENAKDVQIVAEDDFTDARWFSAQDLKPEMLGPPTLATLRKIGYID
jgi:8-oxo-dGTP pyrophosphatase MutT (NUDIX family)